MSYIRYNNSAIEVNQGAPNQCSAKDNICKAECKVNCADVRDIDIETAPNTITSIVALATGAVIKVPVVLAELTVQINANSVIRLPEHAYQIKSIGKQVKVTQCILLQDTNILFIKGFIRKNIDYSTRFCSNAESVCGEIHHCTVDVPFNTTTPVTFNGIAPLPPIASTVSEFEYFKREAISHPDFSEKDELLSGDLRENNQITTEFFNELPFCELISARIVEFDEQLFPTHPKCIITPFEEKTFNGIEEKMVIFITLKLLQNRQVAVPRVSATVSEDC